jgi:hypothetical protein
LSICSSITGASRPTAAASTAAPPRVLGEQLCVVASSIPGEKVGAQIALGQLVERVLGGARVEQVAPDQRVEGHAVQTAGRALVAMRLERPSSCVCFGIAARPAPPAAGRASSRSA